MADAVALTSPGLAPGSSPEFSPGSSPGAVTFGIVGAHDDRAEVMALRDAVYVREHGYLDSVTDIAATFDIFDAHAVYIVARDDIDGPLGTVKVTEDSPAGLPTDALADLSGVRRAGRLVEIGHLMALPTARGGGIGRELMRMAVIYGTRKYGATHIVSMFVLSDGGMREFYTGLGFQPVGAPVRDGRIKGSPLCQVAAVDLRAAADLVRSPAGHTAHAVKRLRYFLHDYDFGAYDAWVNGEE
jgi:GNAT superfamily N-acetyltransferase